MSCMPMAGHSEEAAPGEQSQLKEEVAGLQREVEALKAQALATPNMANGGAASVARRHDGAHSPAARSSELADVHED